MWAHLWKTLLSCKKNKSSLNEFMWGKNDSLCATVSMRGVVCISEADFCWASIIICFSEMILSISILIRAASSIFSSNRQLDFISYFWLKHSSNSSSFFCNSSDSPLFPSGLLRLFIKVNRYSKKWLWSFPKLLEKISIISWMYEESKRSKYSSTRIRSWKVSLIHFLSRWTINWYHKLLKW